MTKGQESLLLYLETCAVDHCGRVDLRHMNNDDFEQARKWHEEGFIEFGRIEPRDRELRRGANWVRLPAGAIAMAHRLRRERAERGWQGRSYMTTAEKRGE